ncbi:hypothetical protein FSP39_017040 [Pinctada imbricata]|uniref:Reverse transcriptase domain-containing protein n=1 Tax=Pinctada imbricata TaxID=66713 RepID=A0AA89BVY2_PINIB|nr:hypothetical protein FSP39_017040 [Pinctada imbricata]
MKPKPFSFKRRIWLYDRADFDLFRNKCNNVNWDEIIDDNIHIDRCVMNFNNQIIKIAEECIPNKIITVRQNELPWVDSHIRRLIRRRNRYRKKAKRINSEYLWNKFKIIRNQVVNKLRNAKNNYYENICLKLKSNKFGTKEWWKLSKQLSNPSTKQSIPTLLTDYGTAVHDDTDKANLLNRFFCSQSSINDSGKTLPPSINNVSPVLQAIAIPTPDVKDFLNCLDISKAVGPDGLSPRLLKEAANVLAPPMCKLFNYSLKLKQFPTSWKVANIIPVYKKNDPQKVENYRPISLLCIIAKVFEKCVHKQLHNFIVSIKLLSPHQSGFTKNDSTVNQLLFLTNEFANALEDGKEIRVIFFDITKAFDRVWHAGLLYKLKSFGISGDLLLWIENYLSSRYQKVLFL